MMSPTNAEKSFMKNFYQFSLLSSVDFFMYVPRAQKKKTNALQVPLPRRLSWPPCVSDLQSIYKAESWQRAVTLDDSQTPTLVLHNTSVVV